MAAVRAALACDNADPVDMLKAVQALLKGNSPDGDDEPSEGEEDEEPADMSAQSADEDAGGTFESAGEGWQRRDGNGRSRSAGDDPLRRARDRSPRMSTLQTNRFAAAAQRARRGRAEAQAGTMVKGRPRREDSGDL